MGCNCGQKSGKQTKYEVRYSDGRRTQTFVTEPEARLAVSQSNGAGTLHIS